MIINEMQSHEVQSATLLPRALQVAICSIYRCLWTDTNIRVAIPWNTGWNHNSEPSSTGVRKCLGKGLKITTTHAVFGSVFLSDAGMDWTHINNVCLHPRWSLESVS